MPYLSRMELNSRRRNTAKFINNPHTLHAAVMSCFPEEVSRDDARVLWRLDRTGHNVTLWVSSSTKPSFEHIQEQAGWANEVTWESREYTPLLERLVRGQQYRFRLAANPVVSAKCPDGKQRRLPLVREHEQLGWLANREETIGASFTASVIEDQTLRFKKDKQRITLARVVFDGVLTVENPSALAAALKNGVGKGKGYGLGMLTLASL